MRTALVLTHGSRGDHEPAVALSVALIASGNFEAVHLVLDAHHVSHVPTDPRIIPHPLPLPLPPPLPNGTSSSKSSPTFLPPTSSCSSSSSSSSSSSVKSASPAAPKLSLAQSLSLSLLTARSLFKPLDQMRLYNERQRIDLCNVIVPCLPFVHSIAISIQPHVVVSTPRFHTVALTIAEYLCVPSVLLQLLPTRPTTRFPHLLSSTPMSVLAARAIAASQMTDYAPHPGDDAARECDEHAKTYYTYRNWMMEPCLARLNTLRTRLHLPPLKIEGEKDGGDVFMMMRGNKGNGFGMTMGKKRRTKIRCYSSLSVSSVSSSASSPDANHAQHPIQNHHHAHSHDGVTTNSKRPRSAHRHTRRQKSYSRTRSFIPPLNSSSSSTSPSTPRRNSSSRHQHYNEQHVGHDTHTNDHKDVPHLHHNTHYYYPPQTFRAAPPPSAHVQRPYIVNCYPVQLVPRIPKLMATTLHVPSLCADYIPPGWIPSKEVPDLCSFLLSLSSSSHSSPSSSYDDNEEDEISSSSSSIHVHRSHSHSYSHQYHQKPWILTFGDAVPSSPSVRSRTARALLTALFSTNGNYSYNYNSATNTNGTYVIIIGKQTCSWLSNFRHRVLQPRTHLPHERALATWIDTHIFFANSDNIPLPWLLPKCKARGVICHAGAGTIATALHAGVPIVMAPNTGDQFFWAYLVACSKLGAVVPPDLTNATAEAFNIACNVAGTSAVRVNAERVGKELRRQQSGAKTAANIVARVVSRV